MDQIQQLYTQFLNLFPPFLHPIISIIVVGVLIYSIVQVIRRDFIYLIILIVLLPASVPVLKSIGQGIIDLIKFLLNMS
jgi:hypothetical protein